MNVWIQPCAPGADLYRQPGSAPCSETSPSVHSAIAPSSDEGLQGCRRFKVGRRLGQTVKRR